MQIKVTAADIEQALDALDLAGIAGTTCPIAQALLRVYPGADVYVDEYFVRVGPSIYKTSRQMYAFVRAHDRGGVLSPTTFRLKPV